MRTALIAVLVLTAGSAVAANDYLTRSGGFSCGSEFLILPHTNTSRDVERKERVFIRRTDVLEVWLWGSNHTRPEFAAQVFIKGLGGKPIRRMLLSPTTTTMLLKCLEDG